MTTGDKVRTAGNVTTGDKMTRASPESCGIGHSDSNRCDKVPSVPSYFLNDWQSKHCIKARVLRDKQSVVSAEQEAPPSTKHSSYIDNDYKSCRT